MKILLYADFRSPHARSWAGGLRSAGIDVLCVSSEVLEDDFDAVLPADWTSRARQFLVRRQAQKRDEAVPRRVAGARAEPPEDIQALVAMGRFGARKRLLHKLCQTWKPDLVHALRLPYEAVTALSSRLPVPVVVSTWGQDFVPQAGNSWILKKWISRALRSAAGLQYDARVDLKRAYSYGLEPRVPTLFAAGNFGIDTELFKVSVTRMEGHVVFPRGRAEAANGRGFIRAVQHLKANPNLRFTGVGLKGLEYAEAAAADRELSGRLQLTNRLSRGDFAAVLQQAHVVVSPAFTDGTPNSVLEAVACGASVVAGRIPSVVDLHDELGVLTLVDPHSHTDIAEGILKGLMTSAPKFVVPAPYSLEENRRRVPEFYRRVLAKRFV